MRVARLRANAVADAFPVVFCRCRNPIAVIAMTNFIRRLKLAKRVLYRGQLRLGANSVVQTRRDVFRRAMNAFHVLQKANDFRDRLR